MATLPLPRIVEYLDKLLSIDTVKDAPQAVNGLQLSNATDTVSHVACAVDASLKTIQAAQQAGADFLLVHHGIFWQSMQPITGMAYRKLHSATSANLAIYSAHLPLDIHPQYGNNSLLARACHLTDCIHMPNDLPGILGHYAGTVGDLQELLQQVIGASVHVYAMQGINAPAGNVFICSGGAGGLLPELVKLPCDTFITGEGSHWNIPLAHEIRINLLYGGHYFTETAGVRALGELLREQFDLPVTWIDMPPTAYAE